MTGRGRVPAPAPGRGGRGRAVLIRGGAELSAATNQCAGVGWIPNGGRGGAVAPPRGASSPRPRRLLRARPRASERSNLRTNPAKAEAERPDRGSKARRGRRKAAEHAPLSPLSTLGAARAAPGHCCHWRCLTKSNPDGFLEPKSFGHLSPLEPPGTPRCGSAVE